MRPVLVSILPPQRRVGVVRRIQCRRKVEGADRVDAMLGYGVVCVCVMTIVGEQAAEMEATGGATGTARALTWQIAAHGMALCAAGVVCPFKRSARTEEQRDSTGPKNIKTTQTGGGEKQK